MPPRYFLCAGVGRSGTTALRTSLGLHPHLYYTGTENNILSGILFTALRNCTLPDRRDAMVVSQQEYDRAFEQLFNDLLWSKRAQHPGKILMAACDLRADILDYLLQVFPGIKLLYLVRNGIHVVSSRVLFASLASESFEQHCDIWLRAPRSAEWGKDKPAQFRLVRYEWFQDTERMRAELAGLYDWLGIPWSDAPLQNLRKELYHPTQHPREMTLAANAVSSSPQERDAFEHTRNERWRYWTDAERATFERVCGDGMRALGYPIPWHSSFAFASALARVT